MMHDMPPRSTVWTHEAARQFGRFDGASLTWSRMHAGHQCHVFTAVTRTGRVGALRFVHTFCISVGTHLHDVRLRLATPAENELLRADLPASVQLYDREPLAELGFGLAHSHVTIASAEGRFWIWASHTEVAWDHEAELLIAQTPDAAGWICPSTVDWAALAP